MLLPSCGDCEYDKIGCTGSDTVCKVFAPMKTFLMKQVVHLHSNESHLRSVLAEIMSFSARKSEELSPTQDEGHFNDMMFVADLAENALNQGESK
ncbi:MAG: hypothetical protein IPM06_18780 [Rhizobiales bacterium]|nr:hypothetical protein [Hyphomicrobiales bacterium]